MLRYRIIIFFVFVMICLFMLDRLYEFGLKHNRNEKLSQINTASVGCDVLFHGPCEPLWSVSPGILSRHLDKKIYNLALSHSDFADNYLHLYLYFKHHEAPEYVFLYVTPESLDARYNTFNTFRFIPYLSDTVMYQTVGEMDPSYATWMRLPFIKYAFYNNQLNFNVVQGLKHFLTNREEAFYPDGFEPPARRVWGNHNGYFVNLYQDSVRFFIDQLRLKYLEKIVDLVKARGSKIVLYESPVLNDAALKQVNRDSVIQLIGNFASGKNIQFLQIKDSVMSANRKYFISPLNYNMEGVKRFNDTLARYLKLYLD